MSFKAFIHGTLKPAYLSLERISVKSVGPSAKFSDGSVLVTIVRRNQAPTEISSRDFANRPVAAHILQTKTPREMQVVQIKNFKEIRATLLMPDTVHERDIWQWWHTSSQAKKPSVTSQTSNYNFHGVPDPNATVMPEVVPSMSQRPDFFTSWHITELQRHEAKKCEVAAGTRQGPTEVGEWPTTVGLQEEIRHGRWSSVKK